MTDREKLIAAIERGGRFTVTNPNELTTLRVRDRVRPYDGDHLVIDADHWALTQSRILSDSIGRLKATVDATPGSNGYNGATALVFQDPNVRIHERRQEAINLALATARQAQERVARDAATPIAAIEAIHDLASAIERLAIVLGEVV